MQPFTFCGAIIDLKHADMPATECIRHTIDRTFGELDHERPEYDVILDIGGEKLRAHKELLMNHIPYFRATFSSGYKESSSSLVSLGTEHCQFDPAYIRAIIRSLYDGHFDLSADNLESWLKAAMYLNADTIIEACSRFLFTRVRCDDALSLFGIFHAKGCHALDDRLWRFIDANFVPISYTAKFMELSVEELIEIIQRGSLRVDSEQQVFEAVDRWIAVDRARWVEGARLLNYIRLSSIPIRYIEEEIETMDWVKADPDCVALLNEYKNPARRSNRTDRYCKDTVALLCAADTDGDDRRLRIYNVLTNEWTAIPLPWPLDIDSQSVAVGRKIYFLGQKGEPTGVLDTASNELTELPTMHAGYRSWVSVGVIDDVIYVAGGEDGDDNPTSSLIALDTKADNPVWTQLAPMTWPRFNAAACVYKGLLYVFGGFTTSGFGTRVTAHAECYSPLTNQWNPIAPMRSAMAAHSAAAAFDRIYIGGSTSNPWENIFDAYNPANDAWSRLPALAEPNGYAVVAGGRQLSWHGHRWQLKTFNIEANEWKYELDVHPGEDASEYPCTTWMPVPATTPLPLAAIEEHWITFDETHRP